MVYIGNEWDALLATEFQAPYYHKLREFLKSEYAQHRIYPNMHDIFNALKYTPYSKVKVVILGQDPYHGAGQAHGLCFSVKKGIEPPPSLKNIFAEIKSDLDINPPDHGELTSWAKQGVLLLNTVLTVREGLPNSHKNIGWELLTTKIVELLNDSPNPIVFLLWGANARAKTPILTNPNHLVLTAVHPSPLSAYNGFFGSKHFSKANDFLAKNGIEPINWKIEKLKCEVLK